MTSVTLDVLTCTNGGDIACAELTPVREHWRQRRFHFRRAELQQAVARAARKRFLEAAQQIRWQRRRIVYRCEHQVAVRGENGVQRRREGRSLI
jgi:hypothetical protein